jgi:hypothetical protein
MKRYLLALRLKDSVCGVAEFGKHCFSISSKSYVRIADILIQCLSSKKIKLSLYLIKYCKVWIHIKTTQFKTLDCFSCNSPNDDLEKVETYSIHLHAINKQ